jgi:DNA-binding IclR family transcriptional regulator
MVNRKFPTGRRQLIYRSPAVAEKSAIPRPRASKSAALNVDKTLSKGLHLMEMLAKAGSAGISRLAEDGGYTKSNVHRLLQTLCRTGWTHQTEQGAYQLSFKLWEIAQNWILRFDLPRMAGPHLAELAAATDETVHLAVLDHADIVFIATVETPKPIRIHAPLGSRAPIHCTATGKAILAFLPPSQQQVVLSRQLDGVTGHSLTGKRLLADLERTRRRGYALNFEEWQNGANGIAAPVFLGASETVIASVGIFGPAARLNQNEVRRLAPTICTIAKRISQASALTTSPD